MKIVACLGNPGKKYARNRHNAGFIIGEMIAEQHNIAIKGNKFNAVTGAGKICGEDVLFLFPMTFMNNSGEAVQGALNFYREPPANLIVLHDELELPFGEVRLKFGGGHKGNNGIRSILQHAGTADFFRIRLGVGRPPSSDTGVADYLLSNFPADEYDALRDMLPEASELLESVLTGSAPPS